MEVFKIKLPKESIPNAVIKGLFNNQIANNPQKAKISVLDKETQQIVGIFNTDPATG